MRSSVDLPAPLGPTTPSTSPGATVTETPARIVAAPCAMCRSRAMSVPAIPPAYEDRSDAELLAKRFRDRAIGRHAAFAVEVDADALAPERHETLDRHRVGQRRL